MFDSGLIVTLLIILNSLLARNVYLEQRLLKTIKLASVDPLTGCLNRRGADDAVILILANMRRIKGGECWVIVLDIDHFKKVNDTYGHAAGDQVLKTVSKIIKRTVRSSDVVCRLGGEEFSVLACTTRSGALRLAEKLRVSVANEAGPESEITPRVTISLGVANVDVKGDPSHSWKSALCRADELMYLSKQLGRNRVRVKN